MTSGQAASNWGKTVAGPRRKWRLRPVWNPRGLASWSGGADWRSSSLAASYRTTDLKLDVDYNRNLPAIFLACLQRLVPLFQHFDQLQPMLGGKHLQFVVDLLPNPRSKL